MNDSTKRISEALSSEYGGMEAFFKESQDRLDHFNTLWKQDIELVGRVLRSHLIVEHFLDKYIQRSNPRLPDLSGIGLTFDQKLRMMPDGDGAILSLVPGIRHLNKIRNRIAHSLKVEITNEDRSAFLGVPAFAAMHRELTKRASGEKGAPIDVLEEFAKLAASWLHGLSDGTSDRWQKAFASVGKEFGC